MPQVSAKSQGSRWLDNGEMTLIRKTCRGTIGLPICSCLNSIWQGVAFDTKRKQMILANLSLQGLGTRKEIGEAIYCRENRHSTQGLEQMISAGDLMSRMGCLR